MANEFFSNEYTETLQKVISEVVNNPDEYKGAAYLPSVAMPVAKVRTEVIEASGGLTNEHLPGTEPKYIQNFGTRVQEYEPCFYKEAMVYNEKDILFLRQLGANGRNERGIRQYIDKGIDRLNRRLEARIEYQRWQTIFNGGFDWMGKTISFGVPVGNKVVPIGQVWSSNGTSPNHSADPILDLRYWVMGGYAAFRKYKITKIIMNGNTERWILDNENTRAWLSSYGANPTMTKYDLDHIMGLLIPGLPPIEVYNGWYQEETIVAGKITVGDARYFIPDGKIFFECALPGGDKVGEFVQTVHLASGSMDAPGYGKFLVVEENIAPGTKGGPKNPYIDIVSGVYGGVKLDRPFDLLTADVL